jgi:hypothetical protein
MPSVPLSCNDQITGAARTEFGASPNLDYDSGIEMQSNPLLPNSEMLHVHSYENLGIQGR